MNDANIDTDIFTLLEYDYKIAISASSYNISKVGTYDF
jgi:hypothetical protein